MMKALLWYMPKQLAAWTQQTHVVTPPNQSRLMIFKTNKEKGGQTNGALSNAKRPLTMVEFYMKTMKSLNINIDTQQHCQNSITT